MINSVLKHLSNDKKLSPIIKAVEMPIIQVEKNIYPKLLHSIVSQQLSLKAAASIWQKFLFIFNGDVPLPEQLINTKIETLRSVGFSRAKAQYALNIAEKFVNEKWEFKDWSKVGNEQIMNELTAIKGVGEWTVQMILMFSLARPDVFPVKDLGIKNKMVEIYGLKQAGKELTKKMIEISENWKPYRSYACFALWRYKT